MYYNTNNETGHTLSESWDATAKQDTLILSIFMRLPNENFTPNEIEEVCQQNNKDWPITSIRRAINTLTKRGNLAKTSELRKGKYGKNTHTWKFVTQVRTDINDTDTLGQGSNGF